jgi:hypothetical protein
VASILPKNISEVMMIHKLLREFRDKLFGNDNINSKLDELLRITNKSQNELSLLCDLYGSDKGTLCGRTAHTYTSVYEYLFSDIRSEVKLVFECGLGTNNPNLPSNMGVNGCPGASLRVWRDYFPNAHIIGVDIDKDILFSENRIETGYIDQTSPETIIGYFNSLDEKYQNNFDIMIDDGLHTFDAARCLFENSFSQLKQNEGGGVYIIEDLGDNDVLKFKDYFKQHFTENEIFVNYMLMPVGYHKGDNNLIIIKKLVKK